ncbi:MAG TPA: NusA-like transcription termination signal-binding factor [archaeon]|jgi:N utilization substance protein A|nr:NusA-like transcription termination signal-binding factor [archaeon]
MLVKLGTDSIRNIAAFESVTEVHAHDCLITEDCVYFLVDPANVGLAIGKNGATIRELRKIFGKTVRVFGHYDSPELFIRNAFPNVKSVEMNNGRMTVAIPEEDRMGVIGRSGRNIKAVREIMERHFSIKDLRVK